MTSVDSYELFAGQPKMVETLTNWIKTFQSIWFESLWTNGWCSAKSKEAFIRREIGIEAILLRIKSAMEQRSLRECV